MKNVFKDRGDGTTEMSGFASDPNVVILIDTEDVARLEDFGATWQYHKDRGYCLSTKGGRTLMLHSFIMGTPKGKHTDHIGGTGTVHDNRKSNLRIVSAAQNQYNRYDRATVVFEQNKMGWRFKLAGRYGKGYATEADARRACNQVGKALYGDLWEDYEVEPGEITRYVVPASYGIFYLANLPKHHKNPWRLTRYQRGQKCMGHFATREDAERAREEIISTGSAKKVKKNGFCYCYFGLTLI